MAVSLIRRTVGSVFAHCPILASVGFRHSLLRRRLHRKKKRRAGNLSQLSGSDFTTAPDLSTSAPDDVRIGPRHLRPHDGRPPAHLHRPAMRLHRPPTHQHRPPIHLASAPDTRASSSLAAGLHVLQNLDLLLELVGQGGEAIWGLRLIEVALELVGLHLPALGLESRVHLPRRQEA